MVANNMTTDQTAEKEQQVGLNGFSRRMRKSRRVGRGCSSGFGKTCTRGQKGQKARKGSGVRPGFEGGQMPLQRRLPKFGFRSQKSHVYEITLSDLNRITSDTPINHATLIEIGLVPASSKRVKLICSGAIEKAVITKGIPATVGAKQAVEKAGGKIE